MKIIFETKNKTYVFEVYEKGDSEQLGHTGTHLASVTHAPRPPRALRSGFRGGKA